MIKLKQLLLENFSTDLERFRTPLTLYMKRKFHKEYDDRQLMLFGMTNDGLVNAFLDKVLSIRVYYIFEPGGLPIGSYYGDPETYVAYGKVHKQEDYIEIENVDKERYSKSIEYQKYTDSVIFHELVHAVNYHKKLFDTNVYDLVTPTEKYYADPEETRAYSAQIFDFLVTHLGLSRQKAESLMNKFSTDKSKFRQKWMPKYFDLKD